MYHFLATRSEIVGNVQQSHPLGRCLRHCDFVSHREVLVLKIGENVAKKDGITGRTLESYNSSYKPETDCLVIHQRISPLCTWLALSVRCDDSALMPCSLSASERCPQHISLVETLHVLAHRPPSDGDWPLLCVQYFVLSPYLRTATRTHDSWSHIHGQDGVRNWSIRPVSRSRVLRTY